MEKNNMSPEMENIETKESLTTPETLENIPEAVVEEDLKQKDLEPEQDPVPPKKHKGLKILKRFIPVFAVIAVVGAGAIYIRSRNKAASEKEDAEEIFKHITEVELDFNGGTVEYNPRKEDIKIYYGTNSKYLNLRVYKSGYSFKGFYTSLEEDGVKYFDEGYDLCRTWDIKEDKCTLYAKWYQSYFTQTHVTFEKNGGTGGTTSVDFEDNNKLPSISIPTKDGYVFNGYYTLNNGQGEKIYDENGKSLIALWAVEDPELTLYASWTELAVKTTTITFDKQEGSGGTSSIINTFESAYEKINVPTRDGYDFKGYFTEIDGNGTKYYDEEGKPIELVWPTYISKLTLYAYWTEVPKTSITVTSSTQTYSFELREDLNPNPDKYDGVYVSNTVNIANSKCESKVTFKGYTSFTIYYRSNGQKYYDYLYISRLDSYSETYNAVVNTSENDPTSDEFLSYTFTNLEGKEHYFYVTYTKNGSGNYNDDKAYFYLGK